MQFYNQPIKAVLNELDSTVDGLSSREARSRLETHGENHLQEHKSQPAWLLFVRQFRNVLILILAGAAILSGMVGDIADTIIILVIVLLNAIVGFIQEYRAEKAMEALRKMAATNCRVIRDGGVISIISKGLVPGDVVLLESGDMVPADIRLTESHGLQIDEASLSGESVPVDKHPKALADPNIPLSDRYNMAYKGTLISNGRGKGVVTHTGMNTELGRIAGMLQEEEEQTPLQLRMARFGKKLSYIILLICTVLFVVGVVQGQDIYKVLLLAVSLAVAAIPEALPALITIALSQGASRLAKKHALIRHLPAVETLGSVTVICTDKTGTLTQNRMRVVRSHQTHEYLLLCMALNHNVVFDGEQEPMGEPTEVALVNHAAANTSLKGYAVVQKEYPRVNEIPFDAVRKRMTTVHRMGNRFLIVTKGASESISQLLVDEHQKAELQQFSDKWAKKGERVLAYAFRELNKFPEVFSVDAIERDLRLAGVVGMIDPPREEVKAAIKQCRTAGIKPIMITGDHPATARAIASDIGILKENDLTLTGAVLEQLEEAAFGQQVEHVTVYARVSPEQKLRIVRMLQRKGHFAAMTGDGVNDAPSLKAANIGVAMGINGTDVSKEASDMVLLDDNFATIVNAVREGRRIFDNIRKFVKYIMTCNGAEIWTILLAPMLGMPIPLLPIHILWINLVTDGFPALALASEKVEPNVMKRPPRSTAETLFSDGAGYHIIWVGILMAGVTLGTQAWALYQNIAQWQTMVFTVLSLSQLGHVMAIRSERFFLFDLGVFSNIPLIIAVLSTFLLQMAVIYLPFMNDIFHTSPLSIPQLSLCIGLSLVVFHAVELEKWIRRRLTKR